MKVLHYRSTNSYKNHICTCGVVFTSPLALYWHAFVMWLHEAG